jgi:YVTN family beta-propeller protein
VGLSSVRPAAPPAPVPLGSGSSTVLNGTVILANVSVGSQPTHIAFDGANGFLYVTNFGAPPPLGLGNTVTVVRGSNNSPITTIAVGDDPLSDVYDPTNGFVYVTDYGLGDNVTVINGTSTIASIPVGQNPGYGEYDPTNGYIYVTNHGSSNVSVIDGLRVVANLPVGQYPTSALYDPASGDVYVANFGSANVTVLHGTTIAGSIAVGTAPSFMAYDSSRGTVYVANSGSGNVSILKGTRLLATVTTSGNPNSATFDPGTNQVYVPNVGTDTVDVLANTTLVGNVSVGTTPRFAVYDAANGYVYVADWASGTVSVLDGGSRVAEVAVGVEPYSAFYDPGTAAVYVPDYGGVGSSGVSNVTVLGSAPDAYTVAFTESGLPTGTNWSVQVDSTTYFAGSSTVAFRTPNGSYAYAVPDVPGYAAENATGNANVTGANVSIAITFLPAYDIAFTEAGLPRGTDWSVTFAAQLRSSSGTSIGFLEVNGTYSFTLGRVPGYRANVTNGSLTVSGRGQNVSIGFSLTVYSVAFVEQGLPLGTSWSVDLAGGTRSSSSNQVLFSEPNGSYPYTIVPVPGFAVANRSGVVGVLGGDVRVDLTFLRAFPVLFSEVGLPAGTAWNVTIDGATAASTTAVITTEEPNGTFPYRIGTVAGYWTQWTGSVPVTGASVTVNVTFQRSVYPVQFQATGLGPGAPWSVSWDGTVHAGAAPTISWTAPNGTHRFVVAPPPGYRPAPANGSTVINGSSVAVLIAFAALYAISFVEEGLPSGANWSVGIGSESNRSAGATLVLAEPNGTYAYRIAGPSGYAADAPGGTVAVRGAPVQVLVPFRPVTYAITFHATGLPAGTSWSVSVGGVTNSSRAATVVVWLPNGSYTYSLGLVPGYSSPNVSGSLRVLGGGLSVEVRYHPTTYVVTFEARGLPAGAVWGLAIDSVSYSSSGPGLSVALTNGTYAYAVSAPAGFRGPGSGSVSVIGAAPPAIVLTFSPASPAGEFLGLPSATGYTVVAAALGAVAVIVAMVWLRHRRDHGGGPPSDEGYPSAPDDAPPAAESPGDPGDEGAATPPDLDTEPPPAP